MLRKSISRQNGYSITGQIEFNSIARLKTLRSIVSGAALFVIATATSAVHAQPVQSDMPQNAQPQPFCELHVWPAATPHTTYYGWFHGGEVDGNRRGIKGYPNMYAEALGTPQQASLLSQIEWQMLSGDPGLHVVVHPSTTGADDDRTRITRLVAGGASCYRELIITSLVVEAAAMSSQSVRIMVIRKKFDGADGVPATFSSMAMSPVLIPDKSVPDFDDRMRASVQSAFQTAVGKFMKIQSNH